MAAGPSTTQSPSGPSSGGAVSSYFLTFQSFALFAASIVTVVAVPLRVGFVLVNWLDWLAVDIIVDLIFAMNIVYNLLEQRAAAARAAASVKQPSSSKSSAVGPEHGNASAALSASYTRSGAMLVDVLAVLPLELICFATQHYHPAWRCNRLLRTPGIMILFNLIDGLFPLKPSLMRIAKSGFSIGLLAHVIACIYNLILVSEDPSVIVVFAGVADYLKKPLSGRYALAFYWSFSNMTGYNNTEPSTYLEMIFSVFIQLIGIGLFAAIIGTVGSLVRNLDATKLAHRAKMDAVNEFMSAKNINPLLQAEVRSYFSYLHRSGRGFEKNRALDDLPPYLKNKVKVFVT